jgi:hypothetical protein
MPPAIVTRHLARMLTGSLSVPVKCGTVRTRGLFDNEAMLVDDGAGEVRREQRVLYVPTGTFPTAKQNTRLDIDGSTYEVRAVLPMEDGAVTRYLVAPV